MANKAKIFLTVAFVLVPFCGQYIHAQQTAGQAGGQPQTLRWRGVDSAAHDTAQPPPASELAQAASRLEELPQGFGPRDTARPASAVVKASATSAVRSSATANIKLPCGDGQVWREYDISPYTLRVTATNRPEQAVVDWILRETGYEAWHTDPLGILSATPRKLRVYHTPEMQALVGGIVDRFVASEASTHAFGMRVVTVNSPNWRTKARRYLLPVSVQTPGVQAWVMQKEDASVFLAELNRRTDYREHSSPHLLINNGQSAVVSTSQTHSYVRDVTLKPQVWPGFEQQTGRFDEGFSIEFSPLLSIDGGTIDATVKCSINQLEKLLPVMIDAPTQASPRQRAKTEVPQTTHFNFHERFRWPTSQVLLISMGMVALPASKDKTLVPGVPLPFGNTPARADLLVFIESRGEICQGANTPQTARHGASQYHGRY